MDLLQFNQDIQSPLWFQTHDYIINKQGEAPNLEPLVEILSFARQCDVAQVLHNLLLVGFCTEHISRIKRTFDVLKPLYDNPNIAAVCIQSPPTQFRWGTWMTQVHQRRNAAKRLPPTLEPGVGDFLLTYAHCMPPVLKGTLKAMTEGDGILLPWDRFLGMPAHVTPREETNLRTKIPDISARIEQWNTRVQREVLLHKILEHEIVESNISTPFRGRKI